MPEIHAEAPPKDEESEEEGEESKDEEGGEEKEEGEGGEEGGEDEGEGGDEEGGEEEEEEEEEEVEDPKPKLEEGKGCLYHTIFHPIAHARCYALVIERRKLNACTHADGFPPPPFPPTLPPTSLLPSTPPLSCTNPLTHSLFFKQNAPAQHNASHTSTISTNAPSASPSSMRTQTIRDQRRIVLRNVSVIFIYCLFIHIAEREREGEGEGEGEKKK